MLATGSRTFFEIFVLIPFCMARVEWRELVDVLERLGWRNIIVVGNCRDQDFIKTLSLANITASCIFNDQYFNASEAGQDRNSYPYHLFPDPSEDLTELKEYLLQARKPYSAMLLTQSPHGVKRLGEFLIGVNLPHGFFRVHMAQGEDTSLYRVQTFLDGSHLEDLWNVGHSGFYEESFDMQGHAISTIGLPWKPWFILGKECPSEPCQKPSGVVPDILDTLGAMYNFSWTVVSEPNKDWGVTPVTGSDGKLHYVGVLGAVANKTHDMALPLWAFFHQRTGYMDLTNGVIKSPRVLMMDGNKARVDYTIFIRPFTYESWLAIGLALFTVLAIFFFCPVVHYVFLDQVSLHGRIVTISAWILFVLLNAFYGGALTMFFTSSSFEPFKNLREALEDTGWELIMLKGYEAHILNKADRGEEPYVQWANKYESDGLLLPTMKDLIEKLTKGRYFTITEYIRTSSFLHDHPMPDFSPLSVGESLMWHQASLMIATKNSPLTPMLNRGIARMRQAGVVELIMKHHNKRLPGTDENDSSSSTLVLGSKELASIFIVGLLTLGTVLLIFGAELVTTKLGKLKQQLTLFGVK